MIPELKINKKFLEMVEDGYQDKFDKLSQPLNGFGDNEIPIYRTNSEMFVGKNQMFDEFHYVSLEQYGYSPTEMALSKFLKQYQDSNEPYMVTVRLIDIDIAEEDENYSIFIFENGDVYNNEFVEYVAEYGYPTTDYVHQLIKFNIFKLKKI